MFHLCHEDKYTKEFKVCVNIHTHSYIFLIILDFTDSLGFVFCIEGTKQCQFEHLTFKKFQYCLHKINPASFWVNTIVKTKSLFRITRCLACGWRRAEFFWMSLNFVLTKSCGNRACVPICSVKWQVSSCQECVCAARAD